MFLCISQILIIGDITDITDILLKVALNIIILKLITDCICAPGLSILSLSKILIFGILF